MTIVHNELDQQTWDIFVQKHGPRSGRFLQSWGWGEFQKLVGENVDRVAWMSNVNEPVSIAQVIQKTVPYFGTYMYVPRGPIGAVSVVNISEIAHNDLFLRMESAFESDHPQPLLVKEGGLRTPSIQPAHTFITNLSPSSDELLANMHEKTRYNIRLAEKKGVQIEIGSATIDDVWPVFEATASRDVFRLHGKEYYRKMIECGVAFLAVAKHDGDILAANIMVDFGDTRTYLHGASSNVKRNLMAPYLLHWELIKEAKSRGIKFYDWWGVAPVDAPADHPWSGISRFKRGFGGEEVAYPDAVDIVLKPVRYTAYRFARSIRRILR